jgi:hypothetical protein
MANEFELKGWLKGLGLADDVVADISTKITDEKVLTALKDQVMAQSDYSRSMDGLKKDRDRLQKEFDDKLKKEMDSLGNYRGEFDARYKKAADERLAAENRLNSVKSQLEALANEYALPEDAIKPILEGSRVATPATPTAPAAPSVDTSQFLTREQFGKDAQFYKRLPIEYQRIAAVHQSLFKQDPFLEDANGQCIMDRVLAKAENDKVTLRQAWEQEFSVGTKRAEVAAAERAEADKKLVAETERRIRSEIAVENPAAFKRPAGLPHSPALEMAGPPKKADGTPTNANAPAFQRATASQSEDRVANAVRAWQATIDEGHAA